MNGHFINLRVASALRGNVNTVWTWPRCSCGDLEEIAMSSKYTKVDCHLSVARTTSIVRLKVPRALCNPNDM